MSYVINTSVRLNICKFFNVNQFLNYNDFNTDDDHI